MKYLLLYTVCLLILFSCSKDKTAGLPLLANNSGELKYKGMFRPTQWIMVSGEARIYTMGGDSFLQLDSFSVSSGPDLKVYLSKKDIPFEFINLGALKTNNGTQRYKVPSGTDFSLYSYVLIHCQQYNHLFAIAELKP